MRFRRTLHMIISPFSVCNNRNLVFEPGSVQGLADDVSFYGNNTVLFTGGSSLRESGTLDKIEKSFKEKGIDRQLFTVRGEPSPELVDEITAEIRGGKLPDCIAAVGGGSVIDTAKAVSAMLCEEGSVCDFLEGIGDRKPSGKKIPFIAVPTTAGTGSEATYNAVLSRVGENGFKKSLRHTNYIPDSVIIDPDLYKSCPPRVAAASGLDALSQLVESYVSTRASFYTDILAVGAIEGVLESLPIVCRLRDESEYCDDDCGNAWAKMAYGAYISGFSLANSGYGIIHGIAGPAGGYFNAPHGSFCGTLLAAGMRATIIKLEKERPESPGLMKFTKLGYIASKSDDMLPKEARMRFIQILETLTDNLKIPRLGDFGITEKDLGKIAGASSARNNPVNFDKKEIEDILRTRL